MIQHIDSSKLSNENVDINIIDNLNNPQYQSTLIKEYLLANDYNIEDKDIDRTIKINEELNLEIIDEVKKYKAHKWIPKKLEFSNLFSYGENNVIDFSKLRGSIGLFGKNRSGKSSILDVILFALFDKCSRSYKSLDVLNKKLDSFSIHFEFELDNQLYCVDKYCEKKYNRSQDAFSAPVEIDFYKYDSDGEKISLNGKERRETKAEIIKYMGSYDDFISTVFSIQNDSMGFIGLTQAERKDFLSRVLKINIFDDLHKLASDKYREMKTLLKKLKSEDPLSVLTETRKNKEGHNKNIKGLQKVFKSLKKELDEKNNEVINKAKEKKTIDEVQDIDVLNNKKNKINVDLKKLEDELLEFDDIKQAKEKSVSNLNKKIDLIDKDKLEKEYQETIDRKDQLKELKHELTNKNNLYLILLNKLKNLEDLEYDENCIYCMNNIFVKDAIASKKKKEERLKEIESFKKQIKEIENTIEDDKNIVIKYDEYKNNITTIKEYINDYKYVLKKIEFNTSSIIDKKELLLNVEDSIKLYKKNQTKIEYNKKIDNELIKLKKEYNDLENETTGIKNEIDRVDRQIVVLEKVENDLLKDLEEINRLDQEIQYYELYINCVNREGIPYYIISKAIPILEEKINNILTIICDFTVKFIMNGKDIEVMICDYQDQYRPVELASGFERFIISLAVRIAIVSISNLPKSNFIAIDEGFGSFDPINLTSLQYVFDYLKSMFDFVFIISHLDTIKSMVDDFYEIEKIGGFSTIII